MTPLEAAIARRDKALRQATGVDPAYPDPGERGIPIEERRRRSQLRLDARVRYDVASADVEALMRSTP